MGMSARLAWLGVALAACSPRVPLPPRGPHVGDEPLVVPYPAPASRPEILREPPDEEAVWIDGHWSWTGGDWQWVAGGWEAPRPGYYYAPAATVRRYNGELFYFEGHWHRAAPPATRAK
jgi:hypothetical protein